ncbi:unnamed protein product [Prunus armeniaca]|uniref:Uncharacterized protein n=1 Tax=Prunus armeniaca TaxID=36596 RepID=A0A6J5VYH0_PRUAR|nr:unnamed protein product [Prunus armeniaca]
MKVCSSAPFSQAESNAAPQKAKARTSHMQGNLHMWLWPGTPAELEEAQKELSLWEEKGTHYFKEEACLYCARLEGEKMEKDFYSLEKRVKNLRLEHRRLLSLIVSRRG